jgi:hypothetical protein
MTCGRSLWSVTFVAFAALGVSAGCSREPTTPEAKRQRGDEIVRQMSDRLAGAVTFTVQTADTRDRMRGGRKVAAKTTRQFTVRRPDRIAMRVTGDSDVKGWYDGRKLTFVSDAQKVWARVNGAPSIDETLDRLAERLAMPMPVADFLYSSPFEALIGKASTGGYVGREPVNGVDCLHVAYQHPGADWDLWVAEQGDPLPKRFRVTDKTVTPARTVEVVFDNWVLGAPVTDAVFTPVVPAGYERIPLAVQAEDLPAQGATAPPASKP